MNVDKTVLSNGLRVVTSALPDRESVALGIWAGVGGRHEPKPISGVSHFIEHLLFKGTPKRSARAISQAIEGRGGYLNAFTQEENTCFYSRVPHNSFSQALDVLSDMYLHASFATADIEKERGVILEEMMMYRDQPQHYVHELLEKSVWVDHALGRPLIGSQKSVRSMDRDALIGFKEQRYVGRNTLVVVAGQIEHSAAVDHVQQLMGALAPGRRPAKRDVPPSVRQNRSALVGKDIEQAHLALGFRVFGRMDPRRHALRVLNVVLGENMSSRLFQVVRERHGLAYSVHSSFHLYRDVGVMVVDAGLDRRAWGKAFKLILGELARLKRTRVGKAELRRAKEYIMGQTRLSLENTSSQMLWLGENFMVREEFIPPEDVLARVEAVNADEVRELASEVFDGARASLAVLTRGEPNKEGGQLEACLAQL